MTRWYDWELQKAAILREIGQITDERDEARMLCEELLAELAKAKDEIERHRMEIDRLRRMLGEEYFY